MESNSLLSVKQFGFRKNHKTIDAIAEVTEKIRKHIGKNGTSLVFLDLKKAFDTISHKHLFEKLDWYGLSGRCKRWIESYLSNRHQFVEIDGIRSQTMPLTCGVPQGSILGPLLFLIYINDLPKVCQSTDVCLFADDTSISRLECSLSDFNNDLEAVHHWLNYNKLSLNIEKTVQVNVTKRSASTDSLLLDGIAIKVETSCKYLGVYVDNKLSFLTHINYFRERLRKQCSVIYRLRHNVPRSFLIRHYTANIKSIIQYGILVYGCTSFSNLSPIFSLQKKIFRLMFFRKNLDSIQDVFLEYKILTVHELHIYELLKFVLRSCSNCTQKTFLITYMNLKLLESLLAALSLLN